MTCYSNLKKRAPRASAGQCHSGWSQESFQLLVVELWMPFICNSVSDEILKRLHAYWIWWTCKYLCLVHLLFTLEITNFPRYQPTLRPVYRSWLLTAEAIRVFFYVIALCGYLVWFLSCFMGISWMEPGFTSVSVTCMDSKNCCLHSPGMYFSVIGQLTKDFNTLFSLTNTHTDGPGETQSLLPWFSHHSPERMRFKASCPESWHAMLWLGARWLE